LRGDRCWGAGAYLRSRLEIITIVRGFLIAHPLCLRFGALVVLGRVVESAIAARMQVGAAVGALISASDPFAGLHFGGCAALPAGHTAVTFQVSGVNRCWRFIQTSKCQVYVGCPRAAHDT
jgi:hypothetical protein